MEIIILLYELFRYHNKHTNDKIQGLEIAVSPIPTS